MSEVRYRAAGAADDAGIRALLGATFPDNVKAQEAFTRWQYWKNPFGATVSWIAEAPDGRVVAHWAAVPVPMVLDGRRTRGAKGVDGATDPAFRGQGLFTTVGARMMADCANHGIHALLTHPNPDAAGGAERAGAQLVSRVAAHVRPLDPAWMAGRFRLPRRAAGLAGAAFHVSAGDDHAVVEAPLPELDDLWAVAGAHVSNGVVRDATWWRWRYVDRPERPYAFVEARRSGRLTGAAAVTVAERFGGRFGLVLEYLAVDARAARGLTAGLGAAASAQGAVGLALAAIPGSGLGRLATGAGFRRLPRRLEPRPLRFMVVDPHGDTAGLAARTWSMAWGDLDHL